MLDTALLNFCATENVRTKGPLAVILHLTRYARDHGLPLDASQMVTDRGGQVLGLGKQAVQNVLRDHGIAQVLAEEGGRTSRGSLQMMQRYIEFLNTLPPGSSLVTVEAWWIDRVRDYFSGKPFKLRFDTTKSLQSVIADLLADARKRQKDMPGNSIQGTVLQHLIGAKLSVALPAVVLEHHGASVADAVSGRSGDFLIGDTVIHTTTAPGEAVIRKCQVNLEAGFRPLVLTLNDRVEVAKALASNAGLAERIEVMGAEQFIATNLHELGFFKTSAQRATFEKLVEAYNQIVLANETDPSLRIEMG